MHTNTKALFASLLKKLNADCVCDIGSRDGDQSVLFRNLLSEARVLAFEANPNNFRKMEADERLRGERIETHPFAIADNEGTSDFYLEDVDYSKSEMEENHGSSSMFFRVGHGAMEYEGGRTIKVRTRRIDDVLKENCPNSSRVALWIDAEGAEYFILKGASGVSDRIYLVHVEVAERPMFENQHLLPEIEEMLGRWGLARCGSRLPKEAGWGDVVFVRKEWAQTLGWRFPTTVWKAFVTKWVRADEIAFLLKYRSPFFYRFLRKLFLKFS